MHENCIIVELELHNFGINGTYCHAAPVPALNSPAPSLIFKIHSLTKVT
jgi:hypothetical protein